jgi:hypothetical protein
MNDGAANPLAMASRLRPATRRGSSAAATPSVAHGGRAAPSAVRERMRAYIRQLELRFPRLRSARLTPERRGVSKAGVYDERTRIGMEYGLAGTGTDGAPIQLDWITADGFIIDIKMRQTGRDTGRGQRPDEGLPDEVGSIGSPPPRRRPRPLFTERDRKQFWRQVNFATAYRLRGVVWETNSPAFAREVAREIRFAVATGLSHGFARVTVR